MTSNSFPSTTILTASDEGRAEPDEMSSVDPILLGISGASVVLVGERRKKKIGEIRLGLTLKEL